MQPKTVARFGTWPSPVTPELVSGATVAFSELAVDGDDVYWLELRPAERGRRALVRWSPGRAAADVLPPAADAGTRVHEYGGGAYAVRDGCIVYSERHDGSVWVLERGSAPRPLVTVPDCRYAGFALDLAHGRVFAVREDHRDRAATAPENALVVLPLATTDPAANAGRIVASGTDFVLAPQLAPDGTQLAWIAWDQPDMPWDATRLFVAGVAADGALEHPRCVAGAQGGESIAGAQWAPDGTLLFVSDRTDWWNAYALRGERAEALAPLAAEFAEPEWVFGRRSLAPIDAQRVLCAYAQDGSFHAGLIAGGQVRELPFGPVDTAPLPFGAGAVFISAPADAPAAIAHAPRLGDAAHAIVRTASALALEADDVSIGEPLTVPTPDGEVTHLFFYPPRNASYAGPAGDLPPLIVMSHGGPTSMHTNALNFGVQWWTSRGFAVAHVNYRGSSGFGRAYRGRLAGEWGVIDVLDCISAARQLAAEGRCDPERIAIRGGSASGMTALLAVATSNVFRAATSLYGVMELEMLAADTHKFEARYTDGLVGPLPATRERYRERSPVNHIATIDAPVLLFQGLDDRVVPPSQAAAMRDALAARGIPVIYEAFEGEGHGFRKAATIARVLERELEFYRDVFGLTA
ncbi:MAG TPA: prolyl oligopeptidase family serine peptidase [Candidatus Lustribacter sp.]|jgi:dipeptidyl aminopeptidase/acylaminoacyl peptidase|nr:prolyl oligopeptidase family serine peptidase [Candidatus Lustribacter sp.]